MSLLRYSFLRHQPVRRKLLFAVLLASLTSAVVTVAAVKVFEIELRAASGGGRILAVSALVAVSLAVLVVISLLISRATLSQIVAPLWELASTAQRVTVAKDYSVRAEVRDPDEIGALTQTFNGMLDTIEENVVERRRAEAALREHTQDLEQRVERRTRELRAAQEQLIRQERLAFLGQLAGGVGHELRRPLSTIGNAIYYLDLIHGGSDEKTREQVEIIRQQINGMDEIIHDLLDSLRIRPEAVGRVALGPWLARVLHRLPSPESVRVINRVPPAETSAPPLPTVWMDSSQMERVISNLVTNAYHAMAEGGELYVEAAAHGGGICLSLRDTGCGISEENLASIFEPLFTTKARGIGLGLTISKNFVEANGGRLEVESTEGVGTTFRIYLPSEPPSHLRDGDDP